MRIRRGEVRFGRLGWVWCGLFGLGGVWQLRCGLFGQGKAWMAVVR